MAHRADLVLQPEYRGLLVVGDIHGHVDLMERMMAHAARERLFFVSCGDLVDRGPSSAHCLLRMRDSVAAGAGAWIRGNHEDKLFRALKGRAVTISGALAATLAELDADGAGAEARTWFLATFESLPFSIRLGSLLVVHGGFGVRMLDLDPLPAPLRARALYGQPSRMPKADGKPVRLYRWVNEIPSGMTVVIGHDPCCDTCLLERPGQQGGRALHIDSAAGKGGPLSAVETDRDGTILRAIRMSRESAETLEIPIRPFSPELVRVTTGDAAGTDAPDNASGKD
ncbi:MAG: metallophosphoesterase [Geminicoccaceae bacterium]|nr:metallophosphoesterase [Geminicoccaceae bacterium]